MSTSRDRFLTLLGDLMDAIAERDKRRGAQAHAARILGVHPSYVSRVSSGSIEEVSEEVADRIAKRTGIRPAYFFDNEEGKHWQAFRTRVSAESQQQKRDRAVIDRMYGMSREAEEQDGPIPDWSTDELLAHWEAWPIVPVLLQAFRARAAMDRGELRTWSRMLHEETESFLNRLAVAMDADRSEEAEGRRAFLELFPYEGR